MLDVDLNVLVLYMWSHQISEKTFFLWERNVLVVSFISFSHLRKSRCKMLSFVRSFVRSCVRSVFQFISFRFDSFYLQRHMDAFLILT